MAPDLLEIRNGMLKHKQCVGIQCKDVCITCAKDKSHGSDKAKSEDMEPKKSFINWLQQHQCISCGINGESLITCLADKVSLSHREEIVKEGQEPPGDINCHNQREQHRTAACAEFGLLRLHTTAA